MKDSPDLPPADPVPGLPGVSAEAMRRVDADLAGDGVALPEPSLECFNGWLSPAGRIYPCLTGNHVPLAQQLAARYELGEADGEWLLTRAGWAKLMTRYSAGAAPVWLFHTLLTGTIHCEFDRLTPAQRKAIREWCAVHGLPGDEWGRAPKEPWVPWLAGTPARAVDGD
jgi:hypothetical protein